MKLSSLLRRVLDPAVKECVDTLPAGICCYWPGGLVKLKNDCMERLSFALAGESLMDGEAFWRMLASGTGDAEFLETGEAPVARLGDGTVRRFERKSFTLDGRPLWEILAIDMTEEYDRNAELRQRRTRVEAMLQRHRALNREIETMIREREVLSAKTRIHDDLSRALLSARQYLAQPDTEGRRELLRLWDGTIRLMRNEGPDIWRDGYVYVRETAEAFGVQLRLEGELPQEPHVKELLSAAAVTCLSNAFRHADAETVTVSVTETARCFRVHICNDGVPPRGEITETGGLADLRRRIRSAGGSMTVRSAPSFALELEIPKEDSMHGLQSAAGGRPEGRPDAD